MDNLKEIHELAVKWLERLKADNMDYAALAEECVSLGFTADLSEIDGSNGNIGEAMRLGSSIRLMCGNAPQSHREWFLSALSTLEQLSSENANVKAVVLLPDYAVLKKKSEKLRTELSMLLLERDELVFVECKNIEMKYMLSLGSLEYRVHELQIAASRLKRKTELIQAKLNRQEKIDITKIEKTLDDEYGAYTKALNKEIDKMNSALERSKGTVLSEEETREIKKLYRSIMKTLHPDINPDISDEQLTLFNNAVTAYENGDIETLRIIETMVSDSPLRDISEDSLSELINECGRLSDMIDSVRGKIKSIKEEYPYTLKDIVENEKKTAEKRAELEGYIKHWSNIINYYEEKLNKLLGGKNERDC